MDERDQVIDINHEQLAQIFSNAEGAELIDEHGRTIRLTAQHLIEAGLSAEDGQIIYHDGEEYMASDGDQYYVVNEEEQHESQFASVHDAPVLKREVAETVEEDIEDGLRPPTLPLLGRSGSLSLQPTEEELNDAEKMRLLLDECRREIQDKEKRIQEIEKNTKHWNRKAHLLSSAYVKATNSNNVETLLTTPAAPSMPFARVYTKTFGVDEQLPEYSFRVLQENGTSCHVVVENLLDAGEVGSRDFPLLDCHQCLRKFQNDELLKHHVQTDHPNKTTFFCRYCEREMFFPNEAAFQTHIRAFHKGTLQSEATTPLETVIDSTPEEEPDWDTLYANSEFDVTENFVYKCSICRKEISGMLDARDHVKDMHGIDDAQRIGSLIKPVGDESVVTSFSCSVCKKTFSRNQFLKLHQLCHVPEHERAVCACKFCGKQFIWTENMQKHLAVHESQQGPVKCPDCKQTFSNSTRLDVHYKARHATRGNKYSCSLCMKTFAVQDALTKHMLSHGQWSCDDCGKRFADEAFLLRHQTTHAAQGHDYVCDVCEKVFVLPANLSIHRNIHTGERPYECEVCEALFSSRHSWRAHEASHELTKPFACTQCDRSFVKKTSLDIHMAVHKNNKPYQCADCGRSYERQEYLEIHLTGCKGSRRLKCQKCSMAFSTKWQLKRHLRWHSQRLSCRCAVCNLRFKNSDQLEKHMIRSHVKPENPTLLLTCSKGELGISKVYENGVMCEVSDLSKYYATKSCKSVNLVEKENEVEKDITADAI